MKDISLKTIFMVLILILILMAIYNNLIKNNESPNAVEEIEKTSKDTIISNNIRIGIIEFDNMNPLLSNNKNVQDISRLIFEPLFALTSDYKIEGILAKEWSKLDETTYIIKLKENIRWQDGNKFDASDVIFTIDMLKKIETNSIYYYNVKDITLLEEIDEYTIKIQIAKEIPYFEYNLIFPIVSSKYFNEENFWQENKNMKPIGTGMFYISEVNNKSILLKKSMNKDNGKSIKLDSINLNLYDSLSKTIKAFKENEIDIFTTANRNIEDYLNKNEYNKQDYINRNYTYLALNCDNRVLANKEVRQAINSGINKQEIVNRIYSGVYRISNFPLDFGSYSYNNNNTVMSYDSNTAKGLLVENGWRYSSRKWSKTVDNKYLSIELNLVVNKNDSNAIRVAENIKEQLSKIGIIINIKKTNEKQYNNYIENRNYDLIILDATYGYSPSLEKYFGSNNLANYENQEIINLLNQTKNIEDENELKQNYTRIVDIYNDEVPYISLYYNTNYMIYSKSLKGNISPNSYDLFNGIQGWYREYKK